jgi:hypothetical protein
MNIYKIIIKQLSRTKLRLNLSKYTIAFLRENVESGNIELKNFVENSIKQHVNYVTIRMEDYRISDTEGIEVQISTILALKLWWIAFINKTSVSTLVNEVLAFSISIFLSQNQALEDYRIEVELNAE